MPKRNFDSEQQQSVVAPSAKIARRLLIKIVASSLLIMTAISAVTFFVTYNQAHDQIVLQLKEEQSSALAHPIAFLNRIERYGDVLGAQFLARYKAAEFIDRANDFDLWYQETDPGVLRLNEQFFEGVKKNGRTTAGVSGFVGLRQAPLTPELKSRVVVAQELLGELGPAWATEVTNTHFTMPENILVMYDPDNAWGLSAAPDLVITDYSTVKSTLVPYNPERRASWTGLYYDLSANFWTITFQKPIDLDGQHLVNASFDISLDGVIRDLMQAPGNPSTKHLILAEKGKVLAVSFPLEVDEKDYGSVFLSSLPAPIASNELLNRLSDMFSPSQGQTLLSESDGYIFIARYIATAGWWYVSIYPDSAIKLAALEGPIQIVLACFVLLLCILAIVYWQVTRVVSSPLQRIASAASMLSLANYEQLLATTSLVKNSDDEVAGVLYSFRAAARRLYRRQAQLEHERDYQVQELAHVTEQLADLDELDGITTILNRRAFDRDLNEVLRTSRKEFIWLCLVEVDDFGTLLFKYGSETADTALRAVLASLNDRFPRTVYRFSATQAAILMRPQNHVDAEEIFGPLCRGVASLSIPAIRGNGSDGVTISLGVTSIDAEDTPTTVMERVHKGLNNAKGRGGNTFDFV